jgi:hypothetical protein
MEVISGCVEAEVGIRRDLPVLFGTPYLSHHYFFEKVDMPCHLSYSVSPGRALPFEDHDFAFYHVLEKLFFTVNNTILWCSLKLYFEPGVNIVRHAEHTHGARVTVVCVVSYWLHSGRQSGRLSSVRSPDQTDDRSRIKI